MRPVSVHPAVISAAVMTMALAAPGPGRADWNPAREAFYKEIVVSGRESGKDYRLVVDTDIYTESQPGLADLRVVRNETEEVPYALFVFPHSIAASQYESKIIANFVSGRANTIIVDIDKPGQKNNRIMLDIGNRNFSRRVQVEGSNDARTWETLTRDAYIYDFSFGGDFPRPGDVRIQRTVDERYTVNFSFATSSRNTAAVYRENQFRYLQVTVFATEQEEPLVINKVVVSSYRDVPAEENEYPCSITALRNNEKEKCSELILALPGKNIPVSGITVVSAAKNYYRTVFIQGSNDRKEWTDIGRGDIFNYNVENFKHSNQTLPFPECRFRYLKLIIHNQDNPDLKIDSVVAKGLNRSLAFPYERPGTMRVYYGNPNLKKPNYDYARFIDAAYARNFPLVGLGGAQANPAYTAEGREQPWTEQYPYLLWTILVAVTLILLFLVAVMIRKMQE